MTQPTNTTQATTFELRVTETGKKSGKYFYQVIDQDGKVLSSRTSDREYQACTIDGGFYFGRLDLIGKGDHGRRLRSIAQNAAAYAAGDTKAIAKYGMSYAATQSTIAYKK